MKGSRTSGNRWQRVEDRRPRSDGRTTASIAAQLYGVSFWDPVALTVTAASLAACALVADSGRPRRVDLADPRAAFGVGGGLQPAARYPPPYQLSGPSQVRLRTWMQ